MAEFVIGFYFGIALVVAIGLIRERAESRQRIQRRLDRL